MLKFNSLASTIMPHELDLWGFLWRQHWCSIHRWSVQCRKDIALGAILLLTQLHMLNHLQMRSTKNDDDAEDVARSLASKMGHLLSCFLSPLWHSGRVIPRGQNMQIFYFKHSITVTFFHSCPPSPISLCNHVFCTHTLSKRMPVGRSVSNRSARVLSLSEKTCF